MELKHYVSAQKNSRRKAAFQFLYMQENFDYYTVYFKGHASQNGDNSAVQHKYMGF